jgi:NADH-quinone oxidoreductase subunit L
MKKPEIPTYLKSKTKMINTVLENNYYFDRFNQSVFAGGARKLGELLWKFGDTKVIDNFFVNGAARVVSVFSSAMSSFQSGLIYQYALAMLMGLVVFLTLFVTLQR